LLNIFLIVVLTVITPANRAFIAPL